MLTVVGYGRVSTDDNDQLNSLNNQTRFFSEYINKNPDWKFGGIYADEGITGTNIKKRDEFKKMLGEALYGNVDLIITKEVSRFARNTVDTLYYVRLLKSKGVGVIFINDNIDSRDKDGEFRLTIMASVAQEESRKTSERVKWGQRRQMEKGFVFGSGPFGYRCHKGILEIKEDEAAIVRDIFNRYVYEQKGISVIARELRDENVSVGGRIEKWSPQAVSRILCNEKYVGDLITQKTVIVDFLEHKQEKNQGQEKQLYFRDHHEPIINRETWELAKEEYSKRTKLVKENSKYTNRYWCSGKIKCGECGSSCITRTSRLKNGRWRAWQCSRAYTYGKTKKQNEGQEKGCDNKIINEKILVSCVHFALKQIKFFKEEIYKEIWEELSNLSLYYDNEEKERKVKKEISNVISKKEQIIDMYLEKKITEEEYERMKIRYDKSLKEFQKNLEDIKIQEKRKIKDNMSLELILEEIKSILLQERTSKELYGQLIERIIIYKKQDLDIFFKYIPMPVCLHYETTGKGETYQAVCSLRNKE
ncbi:recombinase family protein [Aminipila sp.]|uniref:recombinase family protein n=1 Tax=Aminipila sp. TaxID=2060095 RepID=UPI002899045C|nr:recombinase family protein [Aminipila sp.]